MRPLVVAAAVLCAACATEPLPPAGSPAAAASDAVVVSTREPTGCEYAGIVEGRHLAGLTFASYERAIRALQADAARRGANYVSLDSVRQPGANVIFANGRAFRCPPPSNAEGRSGVDQTSH